MRAATKLIALFSYLIVLTGCDKAEKATRQSQIAELQRTNEGLRQSISGLATSNNLAQERISELEQALGTERKLNATFRDQNTALQNKLAIEAQAAEDKRIDSIKETRANLNKIGVRLKKLQAEPVNFRGAGDEQYKQDNETEEERLKQLENSVKTEIGDLVADLTKSRFTNFYALNTNLNSFYGEYEKRIYSERELAEYYARGITDTNEFDEAWSNQISTATSLSIIQIEILKLWPEIPMRAY